MTSPLPAPLAAWHEVVRSRDMRRLAALLHDDVVFHSPVVHTPQRGKAITTAYLTGALHVYGGDFFAAHRSEWDPETLEEGPYDSAKVIQRFEAANEMLARR